MLPKENYNDDLEYLAQLGFEEVKVSDEDINDLKKQIKIKSFSLKAFYIGLSSLFIGMVIGGALFYTVNQSPDSKQSHLNLPIVEQKVDVTPVETQATLLLDTIQVSSENFAKPKVRVVKREEKEPVMVTSMLNSVEVMRSKSIDPSILNASNLQETHLKYIINAPVFYIHDLKVTNYTTLYFKKERFVNLSGVPATSANRGQTGNDGGGFKQSANYYLHDEIAKALYYFKSQKYSEAIVLLKKVATYNKEDLNCDFYLGMAYYHKKNYQVAVEFFDKCLLSSNNAFLQEAMFYKALCLNEGGNKAEAKLLFKKIVEADEFYAAKAKEFL